tara:strand:- start:6180 stop:6338 length:159 start_codon:yes stop_codon:yes gene_type:complete
MGVLVAAEMYVHILPNKLLSYLPALDDDLYLIANGVRGDFGWEIEAFSEAIS